MKKFLKALAALMASTMLFGAMFTSCSSGDDDDGGNETPKITITADSTSVKVDSTLKLTSNVEDVSWKVDKAEYATLSATEDGEFAETATGTTVYLKGVADGSVTVTASKDGYTDGSVPITVGTGGSGGEEEDDDGSYIFTTNDLGYEHTEKSDKETISNVNTYLDEKVTLIASDGMSFTVAGFDSEIEIADLNKTKVRGYIKMTARDAITADNWLTSATRTIAFKVPAGTSKVYIAASNGSSSGGVATKSTNITVVYDKTNIALNKTLASGEASGVATYEINVAAFGLTEDKIFYLYNSKDNGGEDNSTLNLRGIYVQMEQSPLASIEITAQPTKTSYALNETLDTTGIAVTATYENGKTKTVTSKVTYSALDSTAAGDKEITATYTEGGVTRTATFKVTVTDKTLSSIAVNTEKSTSLKTEYSVGDTLDLSGLVLTATYSDGTAAYVEYSDANKDQFSPSGFDSRAATDSQTVTITYAEKTATFTVKISTVAVSSVKVTGDATVMAGQTITLTAKVSPDNATDKAVTWKSSDESKATVDESGVVKGVAAGSVTITATAGGVSSEAFAVTVTDTTYFKSFDLTKTIYVGSPALEDGTATTVTSTVSKQDTAIADKGTVTIPENDTVSLKNSKTAYTLYDESGTWTFSVPKSKSLQIKNGKGAWFSDADETYTTYDSAYTYKNRIAFNKSGATLKLFTGTGEKKLRIDGGGVKTKTSLTVTGAASSTTTWEPTYGGIFYVTVTADESGYVTITGSDSANVCIYGIYAVDEIPASYSASAVGVAGGVATYTTPEINLTGLDESGSISNAADNAVTVSASATKSVSDILYDGSVGTASDTTLSISDMKVSIAGTKTDGTAPTYENGSISVAGATDDTYTVTAALNDDTSKTASAAFTLTDANVPYVTVTFNANAADAAITTTTQQVKSGVATALTTASGLGLSRSGYSFKGWATSENSETVAYADGADITISADTQLFAVWAVATSTTYTLTPSLITEATVASKESTITVNNFDFTIYSSKKTSPVIKNKVSVIEMGGAVKTKVNYIKFTTTGIASVSIKYFASGADKYISILDADGTSAGDTSSNKTASKNTITSGTVSLTKAGTYYLGSADGGIYITELSVTVQK